MEVSDLATSAGINIGLAILFLVLYSVFRKLPGNRGVYNTREMLRESQCKEGKKEEEKQPFALENLVPSAGWVKQAWDLSDDDILQSAGLDALVFLRIFVFGSVVESLSSHKKLLSMKHFAHCKERNRMIMSDRWHMHIFFFLTPFLEIQAPEIWEITLYKMDHDDGKLVTCYIVMSCWLIFLEDPKKWFGILLRLWNSCMWLGRGACCVAGCGFSQSAHLWDVVF